LNRVQGEKRRKIKTAQKKSKRGAKKKTKRNNALKLG